MAVRKKVGEISLIAADCRHQAGKYERLDKPAAYVRHLNICVDSIKVGALIHAEEENAGEIPAEYSDQIEKGGQQGKADDRSCDTGADEIPKRIDSHGIQGIDLLRDAEDTDFGCHCRTGSRSYHDRRKDRAQLPNQRKGDD